jgi:hypothetical protein
MFERLELNAMPGERHHGRARGQCAGVRMDWRGVYWVCVSRASLVRGREASRLCRQTSEKSSL